MIFGMPSTQATSAQSAQSGADRSSSTASTSIIRITDGLSSQHLMATPGTTVTWVNNDNDVHRIKSYKGAGVEFDSGVLEPGQRFSHRFTSASDVMYRDALDARNTSYVGMVMVMTMKPADAGAVTSSTALAPLAQPQQQPFVLTSDGGSSSDGGDNGTAGGPNVKHVTIEMHNSSEFRPGVVTIAKGGTVTWFNDTSDDHTASGAGGINSGRLHRDQSYSHTFNKPGTYDFVCAYHSEMKGTVRVADDSGNVPPPPGNGGGKQPPPPSNGGQKVAVSINSNFSPRNVTIPAGSVVTWTNNDGTPHTATGAGGINSGNLNGGQSYSHTFNTPGTFDYHCSYHSNMTGTIKVTNASGNVPPPPPGGGGGGNPPPPGGGGGGKTPAPPPPGGGGGGGTTAPSKASVSIKDDFFSPKTITVAAGGTVSWTNTGQNAHTVTGTGFDSGPIMSGGHFSHKFASPGTYTYQCVFHSGMTATVKVVGAGGKVPPGAPPGGKQPGGNAPGGKAPGGNAPGGNAPGGGGAAPAPGSKTVTVTMGADSFSPSTVSARVGDTVVWKNTSPVPHTVFGGPMNSGMVSPGQSYTEVLRSPGTISYKCQYHAGMTGTLKVAPAPAGTKLPPPSAGGGVSGPSTGGSLPAAPSAGSSSGDSANAPTPPGSKSYTINMSGDAFNPQTLNARVGDKITWVNQDAVPHNVTGGPLDSGTMMPNATYTTVLTQQGTIQYQCTFHPGMTGTLQVAAAPAGTVVPNTPDQSTSGGSGTTDEGPKPSQKSAKPAAGAQNHQVDIANFLYDPDPVEVHVGDTVTFTNKDAAPHTATAEDKSWDSGNLNQGDSWTLKAEKVGTFHYICTYHPTMAGTLIVKPKTEHISSSPGGSGSSTAPTTMTSASQVAGFSSGWLALLAFLAGLQVQSRFGSRRRNSSSV